MNRRKKMNERITVEKEFSRHLTVRYTDGEFVSATVTTHHPSSSMSGDGCGVIHTQSISSEKEFNSLVAAFKEYIDDLEKV
jgi:hypothetical protein